VTEVWLGRFIFLVVLYLKDIFYGRMTEASSAQFSGQRNHSYLVVLPESEEAGEMRSKAVEASRNCKLHIGVPADFIGTKIELKSSTEMAERLAEWRR